MIAVAFYRSSKTCTTSQLFGELLLLCAFCIRFLLCILMCIPLKWKTEMNPSPNLPTFNASFFLELWLILANFFQSSLLKRALFQAYKAGPWYWRKLPNKVSSQSWFLESTRNRTSVAPASSAFWISSYRNDKTIIIPAYTGPHPSICILGIVYYILLKSGLHQDIYEVCQQFLQLEEGLEHLLLHHHFLWATIEHLTCQWLIKKKIKGGDSLRELHGLVVATPTLHQFARLHF